MVEAGQVYKHSKKGNLYKIVAVAKDCDTLDEVVVYECLYDNPTSLVWIRTLSDFTHKVEINGILVNRFERVS
jgi:hypothetical protein